MTLSFTTIDFETANRARGSICAVGLTKVIDGEVHSSRSWHIMPPDGGGFEEFNIGLHGITADDVVNAPDWVTSLSMILHFVQQDVVLAHNAAFDMSALRAACAFAGIPCPELDYGCTLALSRSLLPGLPMHTLPWVAGSLGIGGLHHHDAESDSRVCASTALSLAKSHGAQDIDELLDIAGVPSRRILDRGRSSRLRPSPNTRFKLPTSAMVAGGPGGRFSGETVCFTGKISIPRDEAQELIVRHGGACNSGAPTKATTLVVTGAYDYRSLRPGADVGRKLQKAFSLQSGGSNLTILTEEEFWQRFDPSEDPPPS